MKPEQDPYAPPLSTQAADMRMAPMFGYVSVLLASIFGFLVGGMIVMAINFQAMGRPRAAIATPVVGLGLLALVGWAVATLEVQLPYARWSISAFWLAVVLASMRWWQGDALAARRAAHIRARPWWLALSIGLLLNFVLFSVFWAVSMVPITIDLPAT